MNGAPEEFIFNNTPSLVSPKNEGEIFNLQQKQPFAVEPVLYSVNKTRIESITTTTSLATINTTRFNLTKNTADYRSEFSISTEFTPWHIFPENSTTIWFSSHNRSSLWRINVESGTVTQFDFDTHITPFRIKVDNSGIVWFSDFFYVDVNESNHLVSFNPRTLSYTTYQISGSIPGLFDFLPVADNIYFSLWLKDSVGVLYPNQSIDLFHLTCSTACGPIELQENSGKIWFSQTYDDSIGFLDISTNQVGKLQLPAEIISPVGINLEENADTVYVWAGSHGGNDISRTQIGTNSHEIFHSIRPMRGEYPTSGINDIITDNFSTAWFVKHFTNKLGRIHIESGAVTEFIIPRQNPFIQWIEVGNDNNDNRLWYAEDGTGYFGYFIQDKAPIVSVSFQDYQEPVTLNVQPGQTITFTVTVEYVSGQGPYNFSGFGHSSHTRSISNFSNSQAILIPGQSMSFIVNFTIDENITPWTYPLFVGVITDNFYSFQRADIVISTLSSTGEFSLFGGLNTINLLIIVIILVLLGINAVFFFKSTKFFKNRGKEKKQKREEIIKE